MKIQAAQDIIPSVRLRRVFMGCVDLEDENKKLSQNFNYCLSSDTASYPRLYESSPTPKWET
jgi:hypothetical protein